MISPSRLIKWLNGVELQYFKKYSTKDRQINEEKTPKEFCDYIAELEVQNGTFRGLLDFAKVENDKVVEWIECKVRSHWKIDREMLLQCLIYEEITQCKNWKLCLMNRKMCYNKIFYNRDWILQKNKKMVEWCYYIIDYVKKNYNRLNYLLAVEKVENELLK